MAFQKPTVNVIKPDIKNLSIYLRSTKKFGKSTLFRDIILEKYGDPSRGLLIGCGNEVGYKMLDNLNVTQITSWKDAVELKDWLINEKGKEHNIEMLAFDTCDEFCLLADEQTIRVSNLETGKKCKSVLGAFGGFYAGPKYSANNLIKPYLTELQLAGFGIMCIAHTKYKTITQKGTVDGEGYMQLTSNLSSEYENAFGDCLDVVLTGVIDRDIEEETVDGKTKRHSTGEVRKLYFRGTTDIDAGGRFAFGSVPEYMIFDKPNMAADFIKVIEEGMEKSKLTKHFASTTFHPTEPAPAPKPEPVVEEKEEVPFDEDVPPMNEPVELAEGEYPDDLLDIIKSEVGKTDKEKKSKAVAILKAHGLKKVGDASEDVLRELYDILCR